MLRAFQDPACRIPPGSIDPARDAQAMEDELILADLGVAERRLERLEKDLKKNRTADLERERDVLDDLPRRARGRPAAARPRPEGRRPEAPARISVSVREAAAHRHQPRRSGSFRQATRRRRIDEAGEAAGLTPFLSRAGTAAVAVCAKIELEIAQLDAADARRRSSPISASPNPGSIA